MKDRYQKFAEALLSFMLVVVITALIIFCLIWGGCTRTVYEPVEKVRIEYQEADTTAIFNNLLKIFESRKEKESRSDSLVDREKETVVLNEKGDTTRHNKERTVYKSSHHEKELETENKALRDSLSVLKTHMESIKTDSVPVIVPVERELSRWEKVKMDFGGFAIGGVFCCLCIGLLMLTYKIKRKTI